MHDQPKYRPLRPSPLFADGSSARPLVEGTVARGTLYEDEAFFTGKVGGVAVKELLDVITNGFGAMPDYKAQIAPRDRWRIVAYVRALQLSQMGTAADIPGGNPDAANKQRQQPAAPGKH
jgi:hypothetical protein